MQKNFYKIDDNRWVEDDDGSSLCNFTETSSDTTWVVVIGLSIFFSFCIWPDQFWNVVCGILGWFLDLGLKLEG
jgi:hypothetical protein